MKRDVFFLPDQTYSQKGPIKKTKRILKKSKTSPFVDPHSEEWPERRIFAKNQTLWLIGGESVARRYLFFWVSALARRYLC